MQHTPEHLQEHGWAWHPGLIDASDAVAVGQDLMTELGGATEPFLRVLTSRIEAHRRDAHGRITNPIIHPGRLDAVRFPRAHGVEQRVFGMGPVVSWVAQLMGAPVALLQSGWWPSSVGTPWHRDVNPLRGDEPMLGLWLALEDIERDAGPFVVFDGSHRVNPGSELALLMAASDALYAQQYVAQQPHEPGAVEQLHTQLNTALAQAGHAPVVALLRAGDAMVWDARALHGSETPRPTGLTRNSLLFHFVRRTDGV